MSCSWLALGLSLIFLPWLEAQHETLCQEMMPQRDNRTNEEVSWSLRDVCCNGYEGTPGHCRPRCDPGCVNAHCTAPQQCTCDLGYATLDDQEFSYAGCQPKCRTCRNGNCISPGRCRCWPGYKMSRESLSCQPVPHLLQPAEQCIPHCRSNCWQKHFSWSHQFPVTPKCSPLCTQNQTESCLQLNRCICNSLNQRLICQDLSAKLPQQYVCSDPIKIHRGSQTESLLGGKQFDQTTTTYLSDQQTSIIQTFENNITEPTYQAVHSTDHEDHSVNIKSDPIKQQDYDQKYLSTEADTRDHTDQSITKQYDHAYPSVGLAHEDDSDQSADIQRIYKKDRINYDRYDQTNSSMTNQSDIAPLRDVREKLHIKALTIEIGSKGDQLESLDRIDQTVAIYQSDPSTTTKVPSIDTTLRNETSLLEELQRIFLINPSNRTDQENATFSSYQMNVTALDQDYQWIADAIREEQQHELNQTNSMDYIDEIDVKHHYDMMNVSKGDDYHIMDSKHNSLLKYLIDPIDLNDSRYKIDSVKILDRNSLQKQSHHIFSSDTTTIDDSDDIPNKGELHNSTLIASLVVFTVITLIIIVIVGVIAVRNRARSPVQTYYSEYFV